MAKSEGIKQLIDELHEITIHGMADALEELYRSSNFDSLDRLGFLEKLIGPQYEMTTARQYENRIERANLKGSPQVLDNCRDSSERSYLPSELISTLASMDFIKEGLNVCILGSSDSGETYLAKALSIQACVKYRVSYQHCEPFVEELVVMKEAIL